MAGIQWTAPQARSPGAMDAASGTLPCCGWVSKQQGEQRWEALPPGTCLLPSLPCPALPCMACPPGEALPTSTGRCSAATARAHFIQQLAQADMPRGCNTSTLTPSAPTDDMAPMQCPEAQVTGLLKEAPSVLQAVPFSFHPLLSIPCEPPWQEHWCQHGQQARHSNSQMAHLHWLCACGPRTCWPSEPTLSHACPHRAASLRHGDSWPCTPVAAWEVGSSAQASYGSVRVWRRGTWSFKRTGSPAPSMADCNEIRMERA